ncbi:MAG TPA: tetratricopeptide repeat protein [Bryobacteraceae bacterium]|nr:tetratricopeptide repeat protein [Bryobacteraceae bacterium]
MIRTKLGHEITAHLGSVGMGEVFQTTQSSRRSRKSMASRNDRQHCRGGCSVNRRRVGFLLTTLLMSVAASAQQPTNAGDTFGLAPGPHAVGFRLLVEQDRSRYVSASDGTGTHARPIRVYVWYPAKATSKPMRFGRYAALADDDVWPAEISGRARDVLKFSRGPLARSLEPAAFEALLQRPMLAAENAKPAAGRFPLMAMGQGLYYESPIAFAALGEFLAGRGFVVVTTPLVGTNSTVVRIDAQDLETQVRDLEFAIARARQLPFVSGDRLGVLGFDMGGMAGVLLAMRNRDVDAFASFDSGIMYPHPSGLPQASPSYDAASLRVPWLHATSPLAMGRPQDPGVKSLFDTAVHSNRYLLVTEGMGHVDFTTYGLIPGRRAMPGYWDDPAPGTARRQGIVADYLTHFFDAFLRADAASVAWLDRDPKVAFPDAQMTLEHRAAIPPSISYDELVRDVVRGDAEAAIGRLRAVDEVEAGRAALDQVHLERLGVSLIFEWGLAKEALPLLAFTVARYPASGQARRTLIEANVQLGNYAAAIEILNAVLQQNPNNAGARARLDEIRKLENEQRK